MSTKWWQNKASTLKLITALLLYSNLYLHAQVIQTDRFELSLGENEEPFEVTPAGNKGVFIYRRLATLKNDVLEVNFLDTTFQSKWHGFLPIERNYVITGKRFFGNALHFVLRYKDFSKNDLQVISLSCDSGQYFTRPIKNFIPFNPSEFLITKKAALIGGYFYKTPVVIYYDFQSGVTKIVPGLFNEPGELTQIKTYDDGSFDILVSAKNLSGKRTIWVRSYDENNELMRSMMLEPEGNKNLLFGRSLKTNNNMQVVAGVYSTNSIEYSKGIFIASIDPAGVQHIRYYNYGELENFFKYLTARREQRIKTRIERRRLKGRKIRFNYRLIVHDLVPYNNQYILLGEAFYPKYTYSNSSFFTPAPGRTNGYQNAVFDGYYYTHAVVLGFNEEGKLKWDNSFEINDVKTYNLEQFVKIDTATNKLGLIYLYENQIRSKVIKDNSVLEGKTSDLLKLKSDNERIKKSDVSINKLEQWYNHNFIAFGIQSLSFERKGFDSKRRVFFINKLHYKH